MQTVIFKSAGYDISGVAEYNAYGGSFNISYSIKAGSKLDGIFKLMIFSSLKPSSKGINADTVDLGPAFASGERRIASQTLAMNGFDAQDIDTFVLAKKEDGGMKPYLTGFGRLVWDVCSLLSPCGTYVPDAPLARVGELLDAHRKVPADDTSYRHTLGQIRAIKNKFKSASWFKFDGFQWFEIPSAASLPDIGAYAHLVSSPFAAEAVRREGRLICGVADGGRTALAIRTDGANPFENASDCAVREGDYWIVGVDFEADGQYFVRLR